MDKTLIIGNVLSILFAVVLLCIGILNMLLVHPVPGAAYLLLSLLYLPQINMLLRKISGYSIPALIKIILGIALIMFTLGVSDLGDMIDKL